LKALGTGTILEANAPLTTQGATISAVQNVPFTATVASFIDPNGGSSVASYSATIDWGDGSAPTAGTVVPNPNSFTVFGFTVVGSHVYAKSGTRGITVTIFKVFDDPVHVFAQAVIGPDVIIPQVLNSFSPTAYTRFTNATIATFIDRSGVAAPGSYLTTIDWGDGTPSSVGFVSALPPIPPTGNPGSSDYGVDAIQGTHAYNAPGNYHVAVTVRGQNGAVASAGGTILVQASDGPKVTGVSFDRLHGRITIGLEGTAAALDQATVANPANYVLTRQGGLAGQYVVTGVSVTPASAGMVDTVVVQINGGKKKLSPGTYLLQVLAGGIADQRGVPLDGEFQGTFPSGDGTPGSNFAARIVTYHNIVGVPVPLTGSASPSPTAAHPAAKPHRAIARPHAATSKLQAPASHARLHVRGQTPPIRPARQPKH
jgi:hypothetical protein